LPNDANCALAAATEIPDFIMTPNYWTAGEGGRSYDPKVRGGTLLARQRRRHSSQFKFKVALEATKGFKTRNEIASKCIKSGWQLEEAAAGITAGGR
jgi:hypothetical protein